MERINDILKRYFEGTSSLSEEKELKNYFNGQAIAPEHEIYKALFQEFASEKEITAPEIPAIQEPVKFNFRRNIVLTFSGVAAACVLLFFVLRTPPTDDYLIVKGRRINNPEMAQQYAEAKIMKSMAVVNKSLEPVESLGKIEKQLNKVEKISEIQQNINNKFSKLKK